LFDLVDFLQSTGLPLVVATLLVLIWRPLVDLPATEGLAGVTRLQRLGAGFAARFNLYGLLFCGSLLALDLAGEGRAEVGRVWVFLMALALLAVYHAVGRGRVSRAQIAGLLAAQFTVCVLIGGRWLTP